MNLENIVAPNCVRRFSWKNIYSKFLARLEEYGKRLTLDTECRISHVSLVFSDKSACQENTRDKWDILQ